MFNVQLNSLWNSLWNSVSHWETAIKFGCFRANYDEKPGKLFHIYGMGLEVCFLSSSCSHCFSSVFAFSLLKHCFPRLAGLEYSPIVKDVHMVIYASSSVLWVARVGSTPDTWNHGNLASTVARPQIKFQVWVWKAQTLGLRSKHPGGWHWPNDTRPAAAAGRKHGPLRLQPNPDSRPNAAGARGGSGCRATPPRGSWGAPIVLLGAEQWPPAIRSPSP